MMRPTSSSAAVPENITKYCARSAGEDVTAFSRAIVTLAQPTTRTRAKAFLFAATKLGSFANARGLELTVELLRPSMIERFVLSEDTLTPSTARTLRTNLRALARDVVSGPPSPVALPRERAHHPYSQAELASYFALARVQSTELRRRRAEALLCLGAGAGLIGAELRRVTGEDVLERSGGLVVVVKGPRPRPVPVLARYREMLLTGARFAGERYLVGGRDPTRSNVTTPLISALTQHSDLERLSCSRLRSTWLVECARLIGLKTFMDAAGVTCTQRLGDLVAAIEPGDEAQSVELLGR
jgi:integrase